MTHEEAKIWELVHEWCNGQSCDIPDFNRRVLMDMILALRQPPVIGLVCPCGRQLDEVDIKFKQCYECGRYWGQTDL